MTRNPHLPSAGHRVIERVRMRFAEPGRARQNSSEHVVDLEDMPRTWIELDERVPVIFEEECLVGTVWVREDRVEGEETCYSEICGDLGRAE